jgi:hypothetical protein
VRAKLAREPSDLYKLKFEDIAKLEHMGEISAKKILANLRAKLPLSLPLFLAALGIEHFGLLTAKLIVSNGFDTLDKLRQATEAQLAAIPGLGPSKARVVVAGLKARSAEIDRCWPSAWCRWRRPTAARWLGPQLLLHRGALRPRKEYEDMVEKHGGTLLSGVTKDLKYLVMSDPNSGSSKAEKAKKYGTKCIDEADFLDLIANIVVVAADPPGYDGGSRVRAAKVRAFVVHVEKSAMANIIGYRDVDAIYLQHEGAERMANRDPAQGDLEYATGDLGVLRPEYYESVETDEPVKLDIAALRRTLCAGDNPFDRAPLVAWRAPPPVAAATPVLDELTHWLAAHPGPQRALLDELPPWLDRLATQDTMTRVRARQRISRAITSPKLLARRDALLARLAP